MKHCRINYSQLSRCSRQEQGIVNYSVTKLPIDRTSAAGLALVGAKRRVALVNQARRSGLTLHVGTALVGATLIVGLSIAVWAIIWRGHQQAISDTKMDSANLTLAFVEQIVRTVGAIDQSVQFLRADIRRQGTAFDLQRWMAQAPTINDLTLQLAVIGPDERLKASSLEANPDLIDLSDHEHFRVHVTEDSGTLLIGKPVVGRASNKPSIQYQTPTWSGRW